MLECYSIRCVGAIWGQEVHLAVLESYIRWLPYSVATIDRSTVCDGFQLQVDQLLLPLLSQFMDYIA